MGVSDGERAEAFARSRACQSYGRRDVSGSAQDAVEIVQSQGEVSEMSFDLILTHDRMAMGGWMSGFNVIIPLARADIRKVSCLAC